MSYWKMAIYPILRRAVNKCVDLTTEEVTVIDDWYNTEREGIVEGVKTSGNKVFFVNHLSYFNVKVRTLNSVLVQRGHKPYKLIRFKVELDENKG